MGSHIDRIRYRSAILTSSRHSVVTTVRNNAKGEQIILTRPEYKDRLSYFIVEDLAAPNAFDACIKAHPSLEAVLHTASPFHYNAADPKKDMIDPAVQGTTSILQSLKAHSTGVKRVVVTSSFASVLNMASHPAVYTEQHWNPITMEQALTGGLMTYVGSKKFAEKAAWDFMQNEKPGFSLTTVNPVLIFGPVEHQLGSLADVNTSNEVFRDMIQGKMKDGITPYEFLYVDVRDVALAHVRAIEVPEAAGRRILAAGGAYSNAKIGQIIKDKFPDLNDKLPEKIDATEPATPFEIDTSPMRDLLGVQFTSLEQSVEDTVKSLLRIQSQ